MQLTFDVDEFVPESDWSNPEKWGQIFGLASIVERVAIVQTEVSVSWQSKVGLQVSAQWIDYLECE